MYFLFNTHWWFLYTQTEAKRPMRWLRSIAKYTKHAGFDLTYLLIKYFLNSKHVGAKEKLVTFLFKKVKPHCEKLKRISEQERNMANLPKGKSPALTRNYTQSFFCKVRHHWLHIVFGLFPFDLPPQMNKSRKVLALGYKMKKVIDTKLSI